MYRFKKNKRKLLWVELMTKFLRYIKPIVFVLVHLIALPRRFRIFIFTQKNLYLKGRYLYPIYLFTTVATWLVIVAYWLALMFALPFWIASFSDTIFNVFILVGWIAFIAELDQRLEINMWTDEINWLTIYREKD